MIPKYAFQVWVDYKLGNGEMKRETRNYETMQGAHAYAGSAMRKQRVSRVRVAVVLEELSKNDAGNVVDFHEPFHKRRD